MEIMELDPSMMLGFLISSFVDLVDLSTRLKQDMEKAYPLLTLIVDVPIPASVSASVSASAQTPPISVQTQAPGSEPSPIPTLPLTPAPPSAPTLAPLTLAVPPVQVTIQAPTPVQASVRLPILDHPATLARIRDPAQAPVVRIPPIIPSQSPVPNPVLECDTLPTSGQTIVDRAPTPVSATLACVRTLDQTLVDYSPVPSPAIDSAPLFESAFLTTPISPIDYSSFPSVAISALSPMTFPAVESVDITPMNGSVQYQDQQDQRDPWLGEIVPGDTTVVIVEAKASIRVRHVEAVIEDDDNEDFPLGESLPPSFTYVPPRMTTAVETLASSSVSRNVVASDGNDTLHHGQRSPSTQSLEPKHPLVRLRESHQDQVQEQYQLVPDITSPPSETSMSSMVTAAAEVDVVDSPPSAPNRARSKRDMKRITKSLRKEGERQLMSMDKSTRKERQQQQLPPSQREREEHRKGHDHTLWQERQQQQQYYTYLEGGHVHNQETLSVKSLDSEEENE
jgi:hypothetical protein